jgi:hypothetical protein
VLNLTNAIKGSGMAMPGMQHRPSSDPCAGTMTDSSTNIHFHGLNLPPLCHQDEVIFTLVNPGDPPFQAALSTLHRPSVDSGRRRPRTYMNETVTLKGTK